MTPSERRAKQKQVDRIKRKRSGKGLPPIPRTKPMRTTRRKDKDKHLWITEPVCPLEKIRLNDREVDGLHWLRMEAERWGAGAEIKAVAGGKMVLARKRA